MIKRVVLAMILSAFASAVLAKTVEAKGEFLYIVPSTQTRVEAQTIAIQGAKDDAIANAFGATVTQNNATQLHQSGDGASIELYSAGGTYQKGEWIETIGDPTIDEYFEDGLHIIKVTIKGKVREIKDSGIDFVSKILRNGTDDKFESSDFRHNDDLYMAFQAPCDGYIAVYLIDADGNTMCLLPYLSQSDGYVRVKANKKYIFFNRDSATDDLAEFTEEYVMQTERELEQNQIMVIFSPNKYFKAVDQELSDRLPRMLSTSEFYSWITKCKAHDPQMVSKEFTITISSDVN